MFYDYPVFFEKNRVWRVYKGGKLFSQFFSDDSEDSNYPEEWVVSSVTALNEGSADPYEGVSKIKDSDLYLNDALNTYKKELLGDRDDLGVLTKILDSAIRLPVQTHPDKGFSRKYFNSPYGKEECWTILATRPSAKIYYGFKKGTTLEQLKKAVELSETDKSAMEELLESYDVKTGDVIYIPANMVHAIGYGCLLLEVQEPTDFTIQPERWCGDYRLSDREMYLGLDKDIALSCFDMNKRYPLPLTGKTIYEKDGCKYQSFIDSDITTSFALRKVTLSDGKFTFDKGACVYVVTSGEAIITSEEYSKDVKTGDYFLIPDCCKGKFTVSADSAEIIECYKPQIK